MCLLLETIKIKNGVARNICYHQRRMDNSIFSLFKEKNKFILDEILNEMDLGGAEISKLRILYDNKSFKYEVIPYEMKKVKSLKKIHSDIDYSFKYANRNSIDELYKMKCDSDDILIIKNGMITDTSYANIIFFDGRRWFTPDTPLLKGTKRQMLIDNNIIYEKSVTENDLHKFKYAKIINSMIDIEESEIIEIDDIV